MDCFICSFPHSVCGENKKNCIYEEWRKDEIWWKDMDWKSWMCYIEVTYTCDGSCYIGGKKLNKERGTCEGCIYA